MRPEARKLFLPVSSAAGGISGIGGGGGGSASRSIATCRRRIEHGRISSTKLLQNLKLVVYFGKVLENPAHLSQRGLLNDMPHMHSLPRERSYGTQVACPPLCPPRSEETPLRGKPRACNGAIPVHVFLPCH